MYIYLHYTKWTDNTELEIEKPNSNWTCLNNKHLTQLKLLYGVANYNLN
jgi:hypothetical protein